MSDAAGVEFIDSAATLAELVARLRRCAWLAVDTEFLREKTYYPKLCLVQVAIPGTVACIDPLAIDDLSPLLELLLDENVTKVFHAARQDLEIFFQLCERVPSPVFDTQVAAPLLGYPDQVGYGNLVKAVLGVNLDKLHTRADWSERPLSAGQLRYAADDVIYLMDLYRDLHDRLLARGRLDWLAGDFRKLSSETLYRTRPDDAWLKVKGGNRLNGARLAVLQALAAWREAQAMQRDRPRGWLLRDDALVDIARQRPDSMAALKKIRGLNERLLQRDGETLLGHVREAAGNKPAPFPGKRRELPLTAAQDALLDIMMAVVRLTAAENDMNPTSLATRRQLEGLVRGDTDSEVLQGWRRPLLGERLQAMLAGETTFTIRDGKVIF